MAHLQHNKEYSVHVYETGPDGKLSLHSLCNYLQDIASDHAVILGFGKDDLMKENRFWVLSRLAVRIKYLPVWGERINVRTWTRGTEKIFALRDFELTDTDGSIIASATSSWLMVDLTTKRVMRPDHLVTRFNSEGVPESALNGNAARIDPMPDNGRQGDETRVVTSELDVNLHVNNVMYIKWATDTYDLDFRLSHFPVSAEINYLAESRLGDVIVVRTLAGKNQGEMVRHSVFRTGDNTELCRLMIAWKNCSL